MTPNDDLARWGEPPASEAELALAHLLANLLECRESTERLPDAHLCEASRELLEASAWLDQMVTTVIEHSGLAENLPCPAGTGGPARPAANAVDLRLRVQRRVAPGSYVLVGSTHPAPTTLRDLKRIPDDPDRVALRTGDRVKLEVVCDRDGYLTVFNVGPQGAFNLLWPDDLAQVAPQPARLPLRVASVVLTPPAGQERLYAVWSRVPLSRDRLAGLAHPGVTVRDMQRVQDVVQELRPEDWHAVLLVLEHVSG
jgi:hypothetical protein